MRAPENILAEVPGTESVSTAMVRAVMAVLKARPDEWIKSGQIAEQVGAATGYTQPAVRKAIAVLLETSGVPVVSSDKGYMFTTDDAKLREYIDSLAARVRGIQARIAAVQRIITAHSQMKPVGGTFDEKAIDEYITARDGNMLPSEVITLAARHGTTAAKVLDRHRRLYPEEWKSAVNYYQSPEVQQWIA